MTKVIKILHLEDSLKDSELIRNIIESAKILHEYFLAENEDDYKFFLDTEKIDIILSDYSLPDFNGNEALKIAREKYSHIPFVFVSGIIGEDSAITAMLNGATDYVLKNKLERLIPAIKRALHEFDLEAKRLQSEINLKEKNELIEAQNLKYIVINKELEKAKEKAEENDRIKTIFLTNLSHELRTPLNEILGFSQLISGVDNKQQIANFAKIINKGGNQLLSIIEDLYIVSSIFSENITKKIKEIKLNNLIDKACFIINDEIIKTNKEDIAFSVFENKTIDDVLVLADYDMFGGIIRRLIRNAIMFTNNGKIEIGYRIENSDNILFYVNDTGIGIASEKQEMIFDFFRQVEESANKEFGGIGSGLAICKSFIEKMNGTIWVESQLGVGSTFYFTLPVFVKPADYVAHLQTSLPNDIVVDLRNLTVLVVDDNESNLVYMEYVLGDMGAKVLTAANGMVALDTVRNTRYIDLILMDLNMPFMDGFEATRMIKKISHNVPIIIQTAYSLPEHIEKAYASGCDGFVKKPINIQELTTTMNECLNKYKDALNE